MSFLSWMRIQPSLHPGTSQRLARPPQERMGTSLLREAKEGLSHPGKTCRQKKRKHDDVRRNVNLYHHGVSCLINAALF